MENVTPKKLEHYPEQPRNKGSSGWTVFWTAVFMIAGFASAGIYFNERLEMMEKKLSDQNKQVAAQSEDALKELHNTQKEILNNRAETASFAKQFTQSLTDMSGMMSSTVASFSQQTGQLAKTIEERDQAQQASLAAVVDQAGNASTQSINRLQEQIGVLAQEMTAVKKVVQETRAETQQVNRELAGLNQQVGDLNKNFDARLASLSDLTQKLTQELAADFEKKAEILDSRLQAIETASNQSLKEVQGQLAALSGQAGHQQERLDQGFQTVTQDLQKVSGAVELSVAASDEANEAIQNRISDLEYNLSGRTQDLLLAMAEGQAKNQDAIQQNNKALSEAKETVAACIQDVKVDVEGIHSVNLSVQDLVRKASSLTAVRDQEMAESLQTFTVTTEGHIQALSGEMTLMGQNLSQLAITLNGQMEEVNKALAAKAMNADTSDSEHRARLTESLKTLQQQVETIQQSLAQGLEQALLKASELINQPQSDEALNSFKGALQDLSASVGNTQEQVKAIGELISRLHLEVNTAGESMEGKPIGMTTDVQTSDTASAQ